MELVFYLGIFLVLVSARGVLRRIFETDVERTRRIKRNAGWPS